MNFLRSILVNMKNYHPNLKDILNYDQEKGIFTWRRRNVSRDVEVRAHKFQPSDAEKNAVFNNRFWGRTAGGRYKKASGYFVQLAIKRVAYRAEYLAWQYVHGVEGFNLMPKDGNGLNLRIDNWEEVG